MQAPVRPNYLRFGPLVVAASSPLAGDRQRASCTADRPCACGIPGTPIGRRVGQMARIVIVARPPAMGVTSGRQKRPSVDWTRPQSGRRCSVVAYGNRRVGGMSDIANSCRQAQGRVITRFPQIRVAKYITFAKDAKQTSLTTACICRRQQTLYETNARCASRRPFDGELVHSVDMRACKCALWGGLREYSA